MLEREEIKIEVMKKKIKKLLSNNNGKNAEKYIHVLHKIIEWEKTYPRTTTKGEFGWKMEEIEGLNGGLLAQLISAGIVGEGYYSNKYHCFLLEDHYSIVEMALDEIERERESALVKSVNLVELPVIDIDAYKDKFEELIRSGNDMLDYWARYINPKVTGMERVKKALLLSIASENDRFGDRGRIHVLLTGDPGTAKSMLMMWIAHYLGGKYCTHRSSDVGLTGAGTGKEIIPGALPNADGKVICIDELDKFKQQQDFAGLLEALSSGKVTINVGQIDATLKARVRCIAGCNRTDRFPEELVDRFDFKIKLEAPKGDEEKEIIGDIIDNWFEEKPSYDGAELRAFLQWINDFKPSITSKTRRIIKKVIHLYIDLRQDGKGNIRRDEAIMRVAYTIAKLNRRDVEPEDAVKAIKLLDDRGITEGKIRALEMLIEKER